MKKRESKLRKMLKDKYTEEELDFILKYEYMGKNAAQWYHLAKVTNDIGEDGVPKWMEFMANFEYTIGFAKMRLDCKEQIEEFGNEK